jgi:hypothetical protein
VLKLNSAPCSISIFPKSRTKSINTQRQKESWVFSAISSRNCHRYLLIFLEKRSIATENPKRNTTNKQKNVIDFKSFDSIR